MSQIHIFALERSLRDLPDYAEGKSMFKERHVNAAKLHSNGTWVVVIKNSIANRPPFETCIQLKDDRVVSMSCTCYQKVACCHVICALFEISSRQIMSESDYEAPQGDEAYQAQDRQEFEDNESSINDFIDDRSQLTEIIEYSDLSQHDEKKTIVQQEFVCSVCLEEIEVPVQFPCLSHTLCYPCTQSLFEYARVDQEGYRKLQCPQCGERHFFKVKSSEELKSRINRSLKRIITSYNEERENNEKIIQELKDLIDKYERRQNRKKVQDDEEQTSMIMKEVEEEKEVQTPQTLRKSRNRFEEDEILMNSNETKRKDLEQTQRRCLKVLSRRVTLTFSEDEVQAVQSCKRNAPNFENEDDFTSKRKAKKLSFYDDE